MDRIALHQLISQLVADEDGFDGDIADRVIAEVPVNDRKRSWWSSGFFRKGAGGNDRHAYASGSGQQGSEEVVRFGGRPAHRVGIYLITHAPGEIYVRAFLRDDAAGGDACIVYSHGRAERMELSCTYSLTLLGARLSLTVWRRWKRRRH